MPLSNSRFYGLTKFLIIFNLIKFIFKHYIN